MIFPATVSGVRADVQPASYPFDHSGDLCNVAHGGFVLHTGAPAWGGRAHDGSHRDPANACRRCHDSTGHFTCWNGWSEQTPSSADPVQRPPMSLRASRAAMTMAIAQPELTAAAVPVPNPSFVKSPDPHKDPTRKRRSQTLGGRGQSKRSKRGALVLATAS